MTLKGNDTASQTPGVSLIRVISDPVGVLAAVVLVEVDDEDVEDVVDGVPTQEARNTTGNTAIKAISAIRLSIRSRLFPSPVFWRSACFAYRADYAAKTHPPSRLCLPCQMIDHRPRVIPLGRVFFAAFPKLANIQ
jgi:hypothetical protein